MFDKLNDIEAMARELSSAKGQKLIGEVVDVDIEKANMRQLNEALRLLDIYQEKLSQSGTAKWFVDGTPFAIEHCPKHKLFFEAGADYYERIFIASNRTGKSVAGAYELACHLTGIYPEWWKGKRFNKPIKAWAAGSDAKATRDTAQKELIGPIGAWGTGMIPNELLGKFWMLAGVPQGVDTIEIKHASGGTSVLSFKNYEQDTKAFYGTALDAIWLDEECPENIYNECLLRTMTTEGLVFVTFTPLHGLTPLVVKFYSKADLLGGAPGLAGIQAEKVEEDDGYDARLANRKKVAKGIINAGWDDAPWLSEDSKRRMLDDTLPHLRDARSKGIPAMGSGNIYPIALDNILVDAFQIPDYYERLFALDVGWNRTAALWVARNPDTDVYYIYDEYYGAREEPVVHAASIKSRGAWIPGVIDPAARGRSQVDGRQLYNMYQQLLDNLMKANNEVESGIQMVYDLLSQGKIKVFRNLMNFQKEYILYRRDLNGKIIKEHDHLMDCLRYLINNIVRALSKQVRQSMMGGTYSGVKRYDI